MRIVGGFYRSRKLEFPLDIDIRPTRDMVREGVFSALGDIENKVVLDLFSGTGAYALESISRGSKKAYLVDNNETSISLIKKNIDSLKVNDACFIYKMDYRIALEKFKKEGIKFDLVFLDPPYKMDIYKEVCDFLVENELLTESSVIVLEWNKELTYSSEYFSKSKKYKYKDNHILILRR